MMRSVCERPFFWRDEQLDAVREQQQAHLVVVSNCAENARRHATSAASSRFDSVVLPKFPEALTSTTNITVNSRSSVNFFTNALPMRAVTLPIDRANFVARLILAHVFKIHSASFENAVVIAGERRFDQTAGFNLKCSNFLENLRRFLSPLVIPSGAKRSRG